MNVIGVAERLSEVTVMRTRIVFTLAWLCLGVAQSVAQPAPRGNERIPVYVRPVDGGDSGFTDPSKDRKDSAKDILGRIDEAKWIAPVASEAEATIILEVLDRDDHTKTSFWAGR